MAFSINTNNAALEALASLRQTNASLTTTENEVSTGKKVNTASDDPAIYAISQTINSQISELSGVSSGLQVTAQVIGTAQTQASSSSSLLSTLASTLTEGQTNGLSAATINQTITKTLAQIDANANGATIEGVNLLSGAIGNGVTSNTAQSAQDLNGTLFQQGGFNATSAGLGLDGLNVNQAGLQVNLGGADPSLSGAAAAATTLTLQTSTFTNSTGSAQDVANKTQFELNDGTNSTLATSVNNAISAAVGSVTLNANGSVATASAGSTYTGAPTQTTDASGNTVYTFSKAGSPTVTLTQSEDANGNYSLKVSNGSDANGNVTSDKTFVSVNITSTTSGTDAATALENAISNQGFGVSKDSSTGDLLIAGANVDAASGNSTLTNGGTGAGITSESGSQYALAAVNAAITSLTKITSSLGSSADEVTGLQNTVTSLSSALTSGVGALTDADLSAESAQLTSLQTKQQLAIQSLSIANSQSQSLLSLFR